MPSFFIVICAYMYIMLKTFKIFAKCLLGLPIEKQTHVSYTISYKGVSKLDKNAQLQQEQDKLNKLIEVHGTQNEIVIKQSQKVDEIITDLYKKGANK